MVFSINFLLAGLRTCFYVWFTSIGFDYWYLEFLVGVLLYLVYLWFTIPRVHKVYDWIEKVWLGDSRLAVSTDYLFAALHIMNEVLVIPMTFWLLKMIVLFLKSH